MKKVVLLLSSVALLTACDPKPRDPSESWSDQERFHAYIKMAADTTYGVGTSKRLPVEERLFTSKVIDQKIDEVQRMLAPNPYLAWMFGNCFPNTLETTVHYQQIDDDDDTFVCTGDIAAMWLRDSGAQVWPYVQFANSDPALKKMLRGVILRQWKCINLEKT